MPQFTSHDLDRIVAETFVDHVELHAAIPSTNSRALELTKEEPHAHNCTLVLAEKQTAGRGRATNQWWSAEGALTCSLLLNSQHFALPSNRWPLLSLITGLAVCETIDGFLPDGLTRIKWPNDVYIRGRKVCGILVEAATGSQESLVVGIGVNVNNSLDNAPKEVSERAITLCDVAGKNISCIDFLIGLLRQIEFHFASLIADGDQFSAQWNKRCLLTGQKIQIDTPKQKITGLCRGINAEGALLLETDNGVEPCYSGVVTQFNSGC